MLQSFINVFKGKKEFSERIKSRHGTFWKDPQAETVRNTRMDANDPIESWKDVENWQRKLSNKCNSREFAKMHNCRVPDLYWRGRDYANIDFDKFPEKHIIKPAMGHSSKLVFLMTNSTNLLDGQMYTKEDIMEVLSAALDKNPDLEFLIEEFVKNEKGEYKIQDDYKVYTFNGEVACIGVINRLSPTTGFTRFYDENWNVMENMNTYFPEAPYQEPPKCLKEIVGHAKKLSKAYEIFVRIDFYATDKGAVFGEFTPTPFLGKYFTPHAEKLFISHWDKYCKGMI